MSNPIYNQNDETRPVPAINWFIDINGEKYFEILESHVDNVMPGQYINKDGIVYDRNTGNFRYPRKTGAQYLQMTVHLKNKTNYTIAIHRLLMLVFNYEYGCEKKVVNHIDGDKFNNSFDNLEWCTSSENTRHAYATGLLTPLVGEDASSAKLTNDQVREICKELEKPRSFGQFTELAKKYDINTTVITGIARGRIWQSISKDYNIDFSKSGVDSILTEDQVREICEELSKNRYMGQGKELAKKYNVGEYIITEIATRQNWKHISKDYIFKPSPKVASRFTNEEIHLICQILQEFGKLDNEVFNIISNRLNIKDLDHNTIQTIRRIYRREYHTSISSQYVW